MFGTRLEIVEREQATGSSKVSLRHFNYYCDVLSILMEDKCNACNEFVLEERANNNTPETAGEKSNTNNSFARKQQENKRRRGRHSNNSNSHNQTTRLLTSHASEQLLTESDLRVIDRIGLALIQFAYATNRLSDEWVAAHEPAGQGQLLPLAGRDLDALVPRRAELGVETVREMLDDVVGATPFDGRTHRIAVVHPRFIADTDGVQRAQLEPEEVLRRAQKTRRV